MIQTLHYLKDLKLREVWYILIFGYTFSLKDLKDPKLIFG